MDHIIPVVAGGATTSDNLALACVSCSLRKSARQSVTDPETQKILEKYQKGERNL
ncbi:MAG: HNH endonuclease [Dolichospermum sp.]